MNTRVVCMGDSITFGQHLPFGELAWPARIGCEGRGVCGETTRLALERFPRDVQENPAAVTVLQWGHNDANTWETDGGLPRVSPAAFKANLEEMVARCRAFNTRPFLCTIVPSLKDIPYNERLNDYSLIVETVGRTLDVAVCDVRDEFAQRDLAGLLLDDGVHLSSDGHELFALTLVRSWRDRQP